MLDKAVSDKAVGDMRKSAERMLAMRSPAVDDDWWRTMLAIVIEVQERRAVTVVELTAAGIQAIEGGDPQGA